MTNAPSFTGFCATYAADIRDMTHEERLTLVWSFVSGSLARGTLPPGVRRGFVDMIVAIDMEIVERSSGLAALRDAIEAVDRIRQQPLGGHK